MSIDSYITRITNEIVRNEEQFRIAVKLQDQGLIDQAESILAGLYLKYPEVHEQEFSKTYDEV